MRSWQAQKSPEQGRAFGQISEVPLVFSPGNLELPEELHKHPRCHEFWEQPGYRELAAMRIANGRPHGRPLNEDGSLVDFSAGQ